MKEGVTPRELCDKYNVLHKETYEWFDIGCVEICDRVKLSVYNLSFRFDYFGRTSTPLHSEYVYLNRHPFYILIQSFLLRICQEIYTNLGKNELLEKQEKEQTYCEGCPK